MIYATAKLGIADLLAEGPRSCDELAKATEAHAPSLYRLLRALASVGVFTEVEEGHFGLTALGAGLRTGVAGSLRAFAILEGEEEERAWDDLLHSVKTGQTAFNYVFNMGLFEYLAENAAMAGILNEAMTGFYESRNAGLLTSYDFSQFGTVVDVGGGRGSMIAAILKAHPALQGVLFDLPEVVADARQLLEAAEVAGRCACVGGDFFDSVPGGGDAYVLAAVAHDWDDEHSIAILKSCRRATAQHGKLLLVEQVIPPGNEPSFSKLLDVHMMAVLGGRERTEAESRSLYAAAGFRLTNVIPAGAGASVIEGVPA